MTIQEEKVTAKQRYELRKFVKHMRKYRGRHTELVTVYIPSGYDIHKIIGHLSDEAGTASNIKSTATRKNVQDALEKMIQHLRLFKKTPPNGLCAFSGNVAEKEGTSDVKVWSVEPPIPLNIRIYRCDKTFVIDTLADMAEEKQVYGLVVMDRRDATLALLKGKTIIPLATAHSEVPGKTRAGGQSAARFQRLREGAKKDHYKKVAEYMKANFLGNKHLKGIIIGGPSTTTHDFVNHEYITGDLQKKIIGIKDLSYTGDFGLQELVDKSDDLLAAEEIAQEKKIMQKFFLMLAKEEEKTAYGRADVKKALEMGAVEVLLLSETLDDDIIEQFEDIAEKFNTQTRLISQETREGVQLRDMGKIVAILRYPVHS